MKKSPLSTPSGSCGYARDNWRSHRGGARIESIESRYFSANNNSGVNTPLAKPPFEKDFIPLSVSSPLEKTQRGCWYTATGSGGTRAHRNSPAGGSFNRYKNNGYHAAPNFDNSYSPYKNSAGKNQYSRGWRKRYQRDGMTREKVDVSRYVDTKSFLEDPWAELVKRLEDGREEAKETQFSTRQSASEDSLDPSSSGLDETERLSRDESSFEFKLERMNFSRESKDDSFSDRDVSRDDSTSLKEPV